MALIAGQINPANYPQPNYSGVVQSAQMQAQGMANLGASIGGVIKDFGEAKKEQKKVDAYNKASVKAIEAAITLGGSYGITGAEDTLRPFLEAYNDPSLSPIEKAALLDEGKGMIPNVFGRFDASQADAIQRAQLNARNAPTMPESFKQEDKLLSVAGGNVLVKQGNDGQTYDSSGQYPIYDLAAFISGDPPEVYSDPNRANIDPVTGIDPQSISNAAGNQYFQGKAPLLEDQIDSALYVDGGILPAIDQIPNPSIPRPPNSNQGSFITPSVPQAGTSRLIAEPSKANTTSRIITGEEAQKLGGNSNKKYIVEQVDGETTSIQLVPPDVTPAEQRARQEEEAKKTQTKRAGELAVKSINKFIDEQGNYNASLGSAVGYGENLATGVAKYAPVFRTQSAQDRANQKELQILVEKGILEATSLLKPVSNVDLQLLKTNRPEITDPPELWARWLNNVRDILDNPGSYAAPTNSGIELSSEAQQIIDEYKTK